MTLKKAGKILVFVVLLTVYLNIGWGLGYYYHNNISTKTFESASWHAKLLGGHCVFFSKNETQIKALKEKGPLTDAALASVFWPFILAFSILSWAGHFAFWTFKLIFAGGLFKLVFGVS